MPTNLNNSQLYNIRVSRANHAIDNARECFEVALYRIEKAIEVGGGHKGDFHRLLAKQQFEQAMGWMKQAQDCIRLANLGDKLRV